MAAEGSSKIAVFSIVARHRSRRGMDQGTVRTTRTKQRGHHLPDPINAHQAVDLFEAGALAKKIDAARLCPLLIDLNPSDVEFPLAAFQLKTVTREDVRSLIAMINKSREVNLTDEELTEVFDLRWPQFETSLNAILANPDEAVRVSARRTDNELLNEILALTRGIASQTASLSGPTPERPRGPRPRTAIGSEAADRIWQHVLTQTRQRRPLILGWREKASSVELAETPGLLQVWFSGDDDEAAYNALSSARNTDFIQSVVHEIAPKAKLDWNYIPL